MRNGNRGRLVPRLEQGVVAGSRRELLASLGSAVYAVKYPSGTIKIGYTTKPQARLQSLGVGTRSLLALLLNGTLAEEQAIHDRLDGHAIKGREWYSSDDPDVIAAVNDMRDEMGLGPL